MPEGKEDRKEAVECFTKAAAKNHGGARALLAWCYANGQGVAKDNKQAFKYYQLAVDADPRDLASKRNLGQCYENGIGTADRKDKATRLYAEAAKSGL